MLIGLIRPIETHTITLKVEDIGGFVRYQVSGTSRLG